MKLTTEGFGNLLQPPHSPNTSYGTNAYAVNYFLNSQLSLLTDNLLRVIIPHYYKFCGGGGVCDKLKILKMKLTKSQKKYLKKNLRTKSIEKISKELNFPAKDIKNYIKETYGKGKLEKLVENAKEEQKTNKYNLKYIFALFAVLIFICYANSLSSEFVSDDIAAISQNPLINHISFVKSPLLFNIRNFVIFLINKSVGLVPMYYRLPNILLHLGSTFLIYLIVRLLVSEKVALISSLIFSVHPILVESVTWISGFPYAYTAFFSLLTIYLYFLGKKEKKYYYMSLLTFLISINVLIQSVVLAPIIFIAEISFGKLKANWEKIAPFFLITLSIVPIILTSTKQRAQILETQHYQDKVFTNPAIQIPIAVTQYLKLIFWPSDLALYHTELSFSQVSYLVQLAVFLLFIGGTLWLFKTHKKLFFWPMLFLIALSPTLTPFGISWIVAERYTYLASIGIFVLFSYGVTKLTERFFPSKHNITFIILIIIIIPLSIRTIIRNNDWKNQDTLWLATAKTSPNSPQNHNNLGDYYGRHGNTDMAISEFKKAIELKPNYADAYHNLANTYMDKKDVENAIKNYEKAIEINPNLWQSYQNLGAIYFNLRNFAKAKEYLEAALKINPNNESLKKALDSPEFTF